MNQLIVKVTDNGELHNFEPQILDVLLKKKGKRLLITIEPYSGKPTAAQFGYTFAAIIHQTAKDNGWDSDGLYLHLMENCNKRKSVNPKTGEITMIASGLSHCRDKWEMAVVIDRCCKYLSEAFGYHVHTPDEYFDLLEKKTNEKTT